MYEGVPRIAPDAVRSLSPRGDWRAPSDSSAAAWLADLERLSRDALADVRRAVEGYRDISLPGELVRARVALRAAEISAESGRPDTSFIA